MATALAGCSTSAPLPAMQPPDKILLTDVNGNGIGQVTSPAQVQQLAAFINAQRTGKKWRGDRTVEPTPDVMFHICRGGDMIAMFGTQTRLFTADGHDAPATTAEVEQLLRLSGQDQSLFKRVPLAQSQGSVSCQ